MRLSVHSGIPMESLQERVQRVLKEEVAIVPYDARSPGTLPPRGAAPSHGAATRVGRPHRALRQHPVPGLAAKPIVDMLIEVTDLEARRRSTVPVFPRSRGSRFSLRDGGVLPLVCGPVRDALTVTRLVEAIPTFDTESAALTNFS